MIDVILTMIGIMLLLCGILLVATIAQGIAQISPDIAVAVTSSPNLWPVLQFIAAAVFGSVVTTAAFRMVRRWMRVRAGDRKERKIQERIAAERGDPLRMARELAPDMLPRVTAAVEAIAGLRRLDVAFANQETADAIALADGTLKEVLDRYARLAPSVTEDEARTLARHALGAVVDAGGIAARARASAFDAVGSLFADDARYIASRAGSGEFGPEPMRPI